MTMSLSVTFTDTLHIFGICIYCSTLLETLFSIWMLLMLCLHCSAVIFKISQYGTNRENILFSIILTGHWPLLLKDHGCLHFIMLKWASGKVAFQPKNKRFCLHYLIKLDFVLKNSQQYLSMKLVVIKTILASDEATPSRELSRPLKVSLPIPWYARGSGKQWQKSV